MASKWTVSRNAERRFAVQLRKVAKIVGNIVESHADGKGGFHDERGMVEILRAYSRTLRPWAERVTSRMLAEVTANNEKAWKAHSKEIGKGLRQVASESSLAPVIRRLQSEQVSLIQSLPTLSAARAQKLSMEAALDGKRASEVAEQIAQTGEVTASRATLIARTEIAKSNANITQARAKYVGADHYIWRTAEDADVRDSHAALDGKVFAFDDPPEIPGEGAHGPGEFPNCRCYAEPIIPGDEPNE
jgi:SPP1 gp7 family putative phage head morphogenesis protein